MKNVFESFIAITNLALMNCIRNNCVIEHGCTCLYQNITIKIFRIQVSKCSTFLTVKALTQWTKFFVSGMRLLMSFNKDRVFIPLQLINIIFRGTESINFLDPKIWEPIPKDIKCLEYLRDFKTAIKKMENNILSTQNLQNMTL